MHVLVRCFGKESQALAGLSNEMSWAQLIFNRTVFISCHLFAFVWFWLLQE